MSRQPVLWFIAMCTRAVPANVCHCMEWSTIKNDFGIQNYSETVVQGQAAISSQLLSTKCGYHYDREHGNPPLRTI
jgi:hypothetical protein